MQTMPQQLGEIRRRVALDLTLQVDLMHAIHADQKHMLDSAMTVIVLIGAHGRAERSRAEQYSNRQPDKSIHF
jgi:hypothetical protein